MAWRRYRCAHGHQGRERIVRDEKGVGVVGGEVIVRKEMVIVKERYGIEGQLPVR